MPKLAAPLILLISLFCFFSFASTNGNYQTHSAEFSPTKTPTPDSSAEIESVTLDKEVAILICDHLEYLPKGSVCDDDNLPKLKVSAKTNLPKNDELTYYYTVSGGSIIGQGANVIWDLSGVRPGKYSITVGIGKDKVVSEKSITKTVQVEECGCEPPPPPCICPTLSVSGPSKSVKNGDTIIFEAKAEGGTQESVKYQWTIYGGTIVSGQETGKLSVKVTAENSESVTADVEISADRLCEYCTRTASKSVPVTNK